MVFNGAPRNLSSATACEKAGSLRQKLLLKRRQGEHDVSSEPMQNIAKPIAEKSNDSNLGFQVSRICATHPRVEQIIISSSIFGKISYMSCHYIPLVSNMHIIYVYIFMYDDIFNLE